MSSFDGKVALVTGAASGMGLAIAEAFAAAGAAVGLADIAEAGEDTADRIRSKGGAATFTQCDLSDADAVESFVNGVVKELGGLDCAVNAAAIEGENVALADIDDELFDRMMAVNVRSVFLCMKHELRAMLAGGGGGAIVNFGSTSSFRPQRQQSAYTTSKHAVIGLTRSAAIDYARKGIRINAICPGAIDTPMLRNAVERRGGDLDETARRLSCLNRLGQPDEIARAALWLCSDESSFTLGHALAVDAGYLAS